MSANSGQWRVWFWVDGGYAERLDFSTAPSGEGQWCLTFPPTGLGVPDMDNQDATAVQRDGVSMYRDTYQPRAVRLQVSLTNANCPGGDLRVGLARIMRYWNRNCPGANLLIFPDCLSEDFVIPDDIDPDAYQRSVLGPYLIHGRPRRGGVVHGRSDVGQTILNLVFEGDDQRVGVVRPDLLDGEPTALECLTTPPGSGSVSITYTGDVEEFPVLTLTGPLTAPIDVSTSEGTGFTYTENIPAAETVVVDARSRRAVKSYGVGTDATLLVVSPANLFEALIIRPLVFGGPINFNLATASGADTGTLEVCYGTYLVGV